MSVSSPILALFLVPLSANNRSLKRSMGLFGCEIFVFDQIFVDIHKMWKVNDWKTRLLYNLKVSSDNLDRETRERGCSRLPNQNSFRVRPHTWRKEINWTAAFTKTWHYTFAYSSSCRQYFREVSIRLLQVKQRGREWTNRNWGLLSIALTVCGRELLRSKGNKASFSILIHRPSQLRCHSSLGSIHTRFMQSITGAHFWFVHPLPLWLS